MATTLTSIGSSKKKVEEAPAPAMVVAKEAADRAIASLEAAGEKAWRLGAIEPRESGERIALA